MRPLLIAHSLLIVLAGTSFTPITYFFDGRWSVNLFKFGTNSGFGREYVSPYSELVICTFIGSFVLGALAHNLTIRKSRRVLGAIGLLVSLVGLCCFINEYFQLGRSEYNSWIYVCPPLVLALAFFSLPAGEWLPWSSTPNLPDKPNAG